MRAPTFWDHGRGSIVALLLAPLGWLYGLAVCLRFKLARPVHAVTPVVCIGNFVAGGAGKTPAALAIADLLRQRGGTPGFLTRGHGGSVAGPVLVDAVRHRAADVGDEPLLLVRAGPVIVARDRPEGAARAARMGLSHLILDDGLQNPSLAKDLSLAVVDAEQGFGNGHVIPAGPLRAFAGFQARLVDSIILVGDGRRAGVIERFAGRHGLPLFKARLTPGLDAKSLKGQPVIGFAGIARPDKFRRTLEGTGAEVVAFRGFADHHPFTEAEARELMALAEAEGALLVTTEKDMARLAGGAGAIGDLARAAHVLPVTLKFEDEGALLALIERMLKQRANPARKAANAYRSRVSR